MRLRLGSLWFVNCFLILIFYTYSHVVLFGARFHLMGLNESLVAKNMTFSSCLIKIALVVFVSLISK